MCGLGIRFAEKRLRACLADLTVKPEASISVDASMLAGSVDMMLTSMRRKQHAIRFTAKSQQELSSGGKGTSTSALEPLKWTST